MDSFNPVWDDVDRTLGQLFMMGFNGTIVTPQIKQLIEEQHLGSILLTAKNLKCKNISHPEAAEQATQLVYELQKTAHDAGHPVPLAIGLDQENGGVNSLFDEIYIRQYPSAMGTAATGSPDLAYEIAKATAEETIGLRDQLDTWTMPGYAVQCKEPGELPTRSLLLPSSAHWRSLQVLLPKVLGVRAFGDDPQLVSSYGVSAARGFKEAGLATMGKHFPSYGNLDIGSALDVPTITDSLEQLSLSALIPFRNAVQNGRVDAMMVGGCAMASAGLEVMHACLSEQVVDNLLRGDLKFDGVVVSECLEMEALTHNIGVGGGTVMAIKAGCDIALLCRSFIHQQEAISGLKLGLDNGMISYNRIKKSLTRVLEMKSKCTSWEKALNPPGINRLTSLQPSHTALSRKAYNASISVVRDRNQFLPITNIVEPDEEVLLLTPLVKPLAASAASIAISDSLNHNSPEPHIWERSASVMSGEQVFRELGRSLARARIGKILHTSYTPSGVRPMHESLVARASAVIVVTADANRNLYQGGFTKHLSLLCKTQGTASSARREKPFIVVAVSSPYDFSLDESIGTYICTYDFTETALNSLVAVLCGDLSPTGMLPGSSNRGQQASQSRQHWLVESFNEERDSHALDNLINAIVAGQQGDIKSELAGTTSSAFLLRRPDVSEAHFVVRNSSTQSVYGFCSTYSFKSTSTGVIGCILVDPSRRRLSVGKSLHNRAVRTLLQREGVTQFQLGSRLPSIFLGIPAGRSLESKRLRAWYANLGWNTALSRPVCSMIARNLTDWTPPSAMTASLQTTIAEFDLVYGDEYRDTILEHVKTNSRQGLAEVYKMALGDPGSCGVIRAKRSGDSAVIGTVVIYNQHSNLAEFVPAIKEIGEPTGGISSPVISPSVGEYSTVLQSLLLLGLRQVKDHGNSACLLDHMDRDGNIASLNTMGFEILHAFDEISCDATTWTSAAPAVMDPGAFKISQVEDVW